MNNYELMANSFEVEELEERVEFASWTVKGEVKCNDEGCEGSVGVEIKL